MGTVRAATMALAMGVMVGGPLAAASAAPHDATLNGVVRTGAAQDCAWVIQANQPVPKEATVVVHGIRVHGCAAGAVAAMVNDAARAGVVLAGGGWRDTQAQIRLRIANCGGDTYENVWVKPANQCSPATAIPGRSQHERGLAIDFAAGGRSIVANSAQFAWLKQNAANYGFLNLPSEPWHWSTTGG